jgi:PadR family transcriptional regulator PadR
LTRRIEQISQGAFHVTSGTLFPAQRQMEEAGWQLSQPRQSANNRYVKYYRMTQSGKQQLNAETDQWERVTLLIGNALEAT